MFATGADGAVFANCMALTDPDSTDRYRRASMLIIPTDVEGYELIGNLSIMGDRGGDWASHGEVAHHGARIPADHLLGGKGMGFALARSLLGPGRIHHCIRWIGVCERTLDIMCRHAVERELAPSRPLGTKQAVQQWIAENRAEVVPYDELVEAESLSVCRQRGTLRLEGKTYKVLDGEVVHFRFNV